jgi:hypothetical protein
MAAWTHPRLGRFAHDSLAWIGIVKAPAFDAFAYDTGYSNAGPPDGNYELAFDADDEEEQPSAGAIALAEKVLADAAALVPTVTKAIWEDFNGRGPDSGMWWHGDLSTVAEAMEDSGLPPPTKADDLLKVMRLFRISVRKNADGYDKPVVELCFWAAFEEEHDVGVLTDGKSVVGIGHHIDVSAFESN